MQITPEQLLAEAGHMALEIRIKNQAIAALEAENERLRRHLAEQPSTDGQEAETTAASAEHAHRH